MQEKHFGQPDITEYSQDTLKRKKQNGGYAMVLVIVAIALATILVSVLMSVSLLNYQMKVTEYNAKDNFYSAEIVMDQIHAGLEQEVSDAAGAAYAKTIQTYGTVGSTEGSRVTSFRETYIVNLRNALRNIPTNDDTKYYIGGGDTEKNVIDSSTGAFVYTEGLLSYLDKNLAEKYNANKHNTRATDIINVESADGNCIMMTTATGIVLKGIKVTYVDSEGFYSEIQTDIHIGYPDVALQEASVIPNVFEYSFIADKGVVNEADSATIGDSIYAGKDGFLVKTGKSLSFDGAKYVVSKGKIELEQGAALDIYDGEIWVNGIDVNGGYLNKGTVTAGMIKQPEANYYVSDDLTINQKNSYVSLSGNYYGFSGDKEAAVEGDTRNQSAIIVNGNHVTLRMIDLDKLLLGGNAYIGTGNSDEVEFVESEENAALGLTGGNNKNVLLGTSLAVKTDQIAFLAPAECLGTSGGQVLVGKNPMVATDYQKWMYTYAYDPDYKLLDESKTVKLLGKPLSEYFGGDTGVHYQTVFQTINGESICYVYLKMTEDQAAAYYRDYVAAAESLMSQYASKYKNDILVNDLYTDISSRGNIYTFDGSRNSLQIISNTMTEGSDELQKFQEDRAKYQQNYSALCSKLTTNYSSLSESEKYSTVYSNLINKSALIALGDGGKAEYFSDGYKAIVINNENTGSYSVNQSSDHIKLLIASGDVTVQGNFSGLIISGGTVTIENYTGAAILADKSTVTKLLQSKPADGSDTKSLIESYFVNGNRYVFSSESSGSSSAVVNLADIIAFRNWTKK